MKEKQLNPKLVIREVARSTVSGDLMEIGHLAQYHAEEERNLVRDQ